MKKLKGAITGKVFLKNPSIEEDERYTQLFKEGKIKELIFAFDKKLKIGERGYEGKKIKDVEKKENRKD